MGDRREGTQLDHRRAGPQGLSQATELVDLGSDGRRQWLNEFELGKKPAAPIDMILRVLANVTASLVLLPSDDATASNRHDHDQEWDRVGEIDIDTIVDGLPDDGSP